MVVIIGAGPAGMSAAHHLRREYLIIEKEQEVGGLCRSFDLAGATFDLGGHAFFTKHDYVRNLVEQLCAGGVYHQPRRAWVWSHGAFVRYPFQTNLYGLPTQVVQECLVGLVDLANTHAAHGAANLEEWIQRSLGPGIAKHFLTPYNEKLWAFPLSEISPDWCSDRVVRPDVSAIVSGALGPVEFADFPNATVGYPARGGFEQLYRGFLPRATPHLRRGAVEQVNLSRRCVTTGDGGELEYDWLISTIPLTELVAKSVDLPDEARAAAARLRHNSLYLVNLVFDGASRTEMQRVYAAAPDLAFHKLVLNSNSSAALRQQPCFGIQAEVSWSERKSVDRNGLVPRVYQALVEMGLIGTGDRLRASSVVDVNYAYPVYTAETRRIRRYLFDILKEHRVLCAGRFGEWLYINSDDAVMRGLKRAEIVNAA